MAPKVDPEAIPTVLTENQMKILVFMWAQVDPDPNASIVDSHKIANDHGLAYNSVRKWVATIRKTIRASVEGGAGDDASRKAKSDPKAKVIGGSKKRKDAEIKHDEASEEDKEGPPTKKAKSKVRGRKKTPATDSPELGGEASGEA
ncbi:hypothetical protein EJ05DRAFT_503933 [Pseudovirgaria hyperparasitica]|uniref:Uncharacterized protein n=1 Tax=Pseudovirgaria hyperparasitica TaxID=470096 RepID=A0A6A6VUN6_9PEZI|nr:uncharacterized protein EJ05DRAFT_503933 [Pseudovirgaria hyperparasitica]KAF2754398.1 hypothetical protein EJ05DRAFT_503933 [Pseudovirgaria hyperparasitica]